MALVIKDRIRETSTTSGTGALTLAGAVSGYRSFADIGNANTTYYAIIDSSTNAWEVGLGTYTSSGTSLARNTVLSNSLGTTAFISFSATSKDVFVTYPASKSVYYDQTGNIGIDSALAMPTIRPSLLLDFANSKQLDPRITFTRASTAAYYDGRTVAKAEENLLLQSQTFDNASWSKSNVTVTANSTAAPDGTTTADTITDDATNSSHSAVQLGLLVGSSCTFSCFLKAGTNNFAFLQLSKTSGVENGITVVADLSAGTIGDTDVGTNATLTSTSITSVGNGWYRVSITGSNPTSFERAHVGLVPAATGNTFNAAQRVDYIGTGTTIFAWGAQVEQRNAVTAYTPTTTQAITNYVPQLLTAAAGVARFDHNPTTGESLGLLIEEQRTNLVTYSEQFDNAAWTKSGSSASSNVIVSPNGTIDADKLIEDTSTGSHELSEFAVLVAGTTYAISIFAKADTRTLIRVAGRTFGSWSIFPNAVFNLSSGTVTSISGVSTPTITAVGNGWYRCVVFGTTSATGAGAVVGLVSTGTTSSYTGDGYSGVYIWGAQLESGASPTSYIPTVASQVTRSADSASMTGVNFSSWYRADEGTLYAEASSFSFGVGVTRAITSLQTSGGNDYINTYFRAGTTGIQFETKVGNVSQAIIQSATGLLTNTFYKTVGAYKVNDFNAAFSGTLGTADTSGSIPAAATTFNIGNDSVGGGSVLSGHVRKLAYYPARLSNAQLQALTS